MQPSSDDVVADNRRKIRDISSTFIELDTDRTWGLTFGPSTVEVGVNAVIYKRSTGDQVINGHSDPSHGFGRGTFGDDRGDWVEVTNATLSGSLTSNGRETISEYINGSPPTPSFISYGYNETEASPTDDGVITPSDVQPRSIIQKSKPEPNSVEFTVKLSSTDFAGGPDVEGHELALLSESNDAIARTTFDAQINPDEEVTVGVELVFVGVGLGNSVVTDNFENDLADGVITAAPASIKTFAIGKESQTALSDSSDSLNEEVYQFQGTDQSELRTVRIEGETTSNDAPSEELPLEVGEIGLYDADGKLVWGTKSQTFTFEEGDQLTIDTSFRVM